LIKVDLLQEERVETILVCSSEYCSEAVFDPVDVVRGDLGLWAFTWEAQSAVEYG
jgi:hypothetical protein